MKEARFTKPLTIALPEEIYEAIKEITDAQKISMSEWFRSAADLKIKNDENISKEEK